MTQDDDEQDGKEKAPAFRDPAAAAASAFRSEVSGFTLPAEGRGTGGYGDRIRDKKRGKYGFRNPTSVFLIYLMIDEKLNLVVRQVEAPLGSSLRATEQALFDRAKNETGPFETNFQNMIWKNPCYITLIFANPNVVGENNWKFYWRNDPDHSAIRFQRRKDTHLHGTKIYAENYSFYDGEQIEFVATDGKMYNGFRCINYIRSEVDDLGRERELDYCFEIYLEAPLAAGGYITMLIDPDGQNQGPRT